MAKLVIDAGIVPFTLGADLHGYNVQMPKSADDEVRESNPFFGVAPFSLTIAMSELLGLGVPLEQIVAMVTSNPAKMLRLEDEIGTLAPGRIADVSVLDRLTGSFRLTDNSAKEQIVDTLIYPDFCLRKGERIKADSPLVPPASLLAA
jgi:dihydroorotase